MLRDLPANAPELNPDEYLNCDLTQGAPSGRPARTRHTLKHKAIGHMRKLQNTPARVREYFEAKSIQYAA